MRNKFTMEMSICQAENGFSLDELVKKLADGAVAKLLMSFANSNKGGQPPSSLDYAVASRERM